MADRHTRGRGTATGRGARSARAPGPPVPAPDSSPGTGGCVRLPSPSGGPDPRMLWPNILEAVKNRRRFTWILLSQNAQVTGFDGTTLQIGFVNAGARDNFASSGSEEVLKQALTELFNVHWKVEAVVDPSGGSAPPAPGPGSGYGGGYGAGGAPAPSASRPAPQQQPSAPAPRPASSAPQSQGQGQSHSAPSSGPAPAPRSSAPEPPPISPEDDTPEDDDPDLDESALSGHELIVRELGATVVEEFSNEQ